MIYINTFEPKEFRFKKIMKKYDISQMTSAVENKLELLVNQLKEA